MKQEGIFHKTIQFNVKEYIMIVIVWWRYWHFVKQDNKNEYKNSHRKLTKTKQTKSKEYKKG